MNWSDIACSNRAIRYRMIIHRYCEGLYFDNLIVACVAKCMALAGR